MVVQLLWTDTEVASAYWAYVTHKPWRLIRYFRYPIAALIVSGVILVQYPTSWQLVGSLVLIDAATIAYEIFLSRRNMVQQFKKSRLWQGDVTVSVDAKSVRLSGKDFDIVRDWPELSGIFESRHVFMLVGRSKKILFLPKSGMNESEMAEFGVLATANVAGKLRLTSPLS